MSDKPGISAKDILFCSGNLKTKLIKIADYALGGLLCAVLKPGRTGIKNTDKIKRMLVIRPGGIGDALLLIPFIRELKKLFPEAALDILCEKRNAQVFYLHEGLAGRVLLYDTPGGFLKSVRGGYDIVFDTEQWHNFSAILSYFLGGKRRIGFNTRKARSKFYTDLVSYEQKKYETDNFLNLLNSFRQPSLRVNSISSLQGYQSSRHCEGAARSNLFSGIASSPSAPRNDNEDAAPRNDNEDAAPRNDGGIALCLSAGIPERAWPARNFQKLIDELAKKGYNILLLGGRKERGLAQVVLKGIAAKDFIKDFTAKADLARTAHLLKSSSLYIGSDSGILHLACALGLPTVSLFGPGIIEKWAPRGAGHIVISKGLECSPCTLFGYTPRCHRARCMEAIEVEDVMAAIGHLER